MNEVEFEESTIDGSGLPCFRLKLTPEQASKIYRFWSKHGERDKSMLAQPVMHNGEVYLQGTMFEEEESRVIAQTIEIAHEMTGERNGRETEEVE